MSQGKKIRGPQLVIKCESNKSVERRTVNDNEVSLESNAESILCWSVVYSYSQLYVEDI